MKETTKTSRTAGYLEKIFRALNNDSFGGELEEPIITIQSTPTAFGHVTVAKTWKRKDDWRHELNIAADWLERPIENVVATMIHEMTHLYNIQHNVQDCSRGGTYHNKKFKEEAEKHMIKIDHSDKYGWTITSPNLELLDFIEQQGWQDLQMVEGVNLLDILGTLPKGAAGTNGKTKKPTSTRKYICPKCGNSCRVTKTINIICGDCMEKMVVSE